MKPALKLLHPTEQHKDGPSLSFLRLTRNPALASPTKFVPTKKREGDVIL